MLLGVKEPDVDTASNSTIEPEIEIVKMSDSELTVKLYEQLLSEKPVTIDGKNPTLDDARAIIASDFTPAADMWKGSAPKKVVSRYLAIYY